MSNAAPAAATTTTGNQSPPRQSPRSWPHERRPRTNRGAARARRRESGWQKAVLGQPITSFKAYRASQTFVLGELIRHGKFGDGYIVRVIDRQKVEVMFKDGPRMLAQSLDA